MNLNGISETPLYLLNRYNGLSVGRYIRYPCDRIEQVTISTLVSLNPSRVEAVIVGLDDISEGLSREQNSTYCPQIGEDSIGCCLVEIIDSA